MSTQRELTGLENVLFQLFILLTGLGGSFAIGKRSARDAAQEIVKPHARSAFRRLYSLYQSLSRVANEIEGFQDGERDYSAEVVLLKLQAIVIEQITTADDALEDWYDIIPEEVEQEREKLASRIGRQPNE